MKQSGKHVRPPPAPAPKVGVFLTETLAIACAHASAGSTFETVRIRELRDADAGALRPEGRLWYINGHRPAGATVTMAQTTEHLQSMVRFVMDHPDAPPEALWRHVAGLVTDLTRSSWRCAPLAERLAYATFCSMIPPMLSEARQVSLLRAELEREALPSPVLPNTGITKRAGRQYGRASKRVVLSHGPKREAAE